MRQHLVVCAAQVSLGEERAELFQSSRVDIATGGYFAVSHEFEDARRAETTVQPNNADTICAHNGTPKSFSVIHFQLAGERRPRARKWVRPDAAARRSRYAGRSPSTPARRWG